MIATLAFTLLATSPVGQDAPWLFDTNGDGTYDTVMLDRWGDGQGDIFAIDLDQNGVLEGFLIDVNNDGTIELTVSDSQQNGFIDAVGVDMDQNGVWETVTYDRNENGVADHLETTSVADAVIGATVVGPVTNPDWFYNLMTTTAGITGQATFGTPDSDGDGWYDNQDFYPGDRYRH